MGPVDSPEERGRTAGERCANTALNALLHGLHLSVIAFSCLGWVSPVTRPAHLALAALIALSWFVLGPLLGQGLGFCAITGVQHALWQREGRETPSYMVFLAERLTGRPADPARVNHVTQLVFYATSLASLALTLAG